MGIYRLYRCPIVSVQYVQVINSVNKGKCTVSHSRTMVRRKAILSHGDSGFLPNGMPIRLLMKPKPPAPRSAGKRCGRFHERHTWIALSTLMDESLQDMHVAPIDGASRYMSFYLHG